MPTSLVNDESVSSTSSTPSTLVFPLSNPVSPFSDEYHTPMRVYESYEELIEDVRKVAIKPTVREGCGACVACCGVHKKGAMKWFGMELKKYLRAKDVWIEEDLEFRDEISDLIHGALLKRRGWEHMSVRIPLLNTELGETDSDDD